jgi:tetratricopeptide (TPR) repeat protein
MKSAAAVFLLSFGLYLWSLPPALAPYRDTGEMSVASRTLGVAHPTSYPLYVQIGHVSQSLPLGNRAFRLSLLSAVCGSLALTLLFILCRRRWGPAAGAAAVLLLGLNASFWSVVQVQEMYSLWILCAAALMGGAWALGERYGERRWLAFCLLFGLCLGNRLDLVLWAPGLIWISLGSPGLSGKASFWAGAALLLFPAAMVLLSSNFPVVLLIAGTALWLAPHPSRRWAWAGRSLLAAGLGLSVYLYLPVRSISAPYLDWNHPATLSNLLDSILRTRYGGTLDLLSKNYATGELFGVNLRFYGLHLWENFSLIGLAAVLGGSWLCLRRDPRRWLGMAAAWWWSGPVFLFLANMPPNPHALAIVDPHYLLSELVLVFWAAEGIGWLCSQPGVWLAWTACALLAAVPLWQGRLARMDRREHLFSYDFAKNVLRCAAPGGTVVAKKDVQLYALWHYQVVQGWRPDVRLVAQGLAGTPWYQADFRRRSSGLSLGPLRDAADWRRFISRNPPVFATMDCEVPPEVAAAGRARGLLTAWAEGASSGGEEALWSLMARRGRYEWDGQPDFFTSDLVGSYSQALYQQGRQMFKAGAAEAAERAFQQAWAWQWRFPDPPGFLGFIAYGRGDHQKARGYYEQASRIHEETVRLAESYHSLPELKAGVRRAAAETFTQLGVILERLKDSAAAESSYRRALALAPAAGAHYNLAVLYWSRDPVRAEAELQEALRLDPGHAESARYLAVLRSRRR